jgi:putative transposase
MTWFLIAHIFATLLELIGIGRLSEREKDLEILILRHQLDILERRQKTPIKPNRAEKLTLAVLTNKLKLISNRSAKQLRDTLRIFQPATVLKWHRQLVKRKWTQEHKNKGGRPKISQETKGLIVRLAQENPIWGYGKIEGELLKLGIKVSQTTIRNVLDRHGIVPAPVRYGSIGWRQLMSHYKEQILACDFFTIETIWLKTLYVFFFIELGTRRVHLAGITTNPDSAWVAQQARQFVWQLDENENAFRFLIRDRDSKYTDKFDTVFQAEGIHVIVTLLRAPNANAYAERWVRTVREECLDHILVLSEGHLLRILKTYIDYYETARPHQGLNQQTPVLQKQSHESGPVYKRKILGGIINDYYRAPALRPLYIN